MNLKLMYITNAPQIARIADKTGVDRVWIDLETLGKEKRQEGLNTVKSKHSLIDIKRIKPLLKNSELQVRVNPINANSKEEIESAIQYGADVIMLPYYKTIDEVKQFYRYVKGRVKTVLLLETKEAADILDDVLDMEEVEEIHIGLNDLHLSYGLTFMFELLANGTVEKLCYKMKEKNIRYGFGGIAKLGEGLLPAEYIVAEHYRLQSSAAILSRSFYDSVDETDYEAIEKFFEESITELRCYEKSLDEKESNFFVENQERVKSIVSEIVSKRG